MNSKINISFINFEKEINSLHEALIIGEKKKKSQEFEYFRDSVIQRFEYTLEGAWKLMKIILYENDAIISQSPKSCIKDSYKLGYLKDIDIWFQMLESRNLSSHTYNENFSQELYLNITKYFNYMQNFYENIKGIIVRGEDS